MSGMPDNIDDLIEQVMIAVRSSVGSSGQHQMALLLTTLAHLIHSSPNPVQFLDAAIACLDKHRQRVMGAALHGGDA